MNAKGRNTQAIGWAAAVLMAFLGAAPSDAGEAKDALQRGRAAIQKDDFGQAIVHFTEAIRLDPKLTDAYVARAWVYSETDDHEKAVADYSQAIRLDPRSAEALCGRGQVLAKLGEFDRAMPDLTEAIRLDAKLIEAYLARGWVYSEKREFTKAVADYSEAIKLEPEDVQARADRATCLSALKKYSEAIADLDVAIKLEPKELRYYGARGAARLHRGEYRKGMADMQTAIRLNPRDAGANYKPTTDKELSPEALRHGQEQVRRMVKDRPAMAQYGEESEFLRQWAVRKFAGEDFGEPFDWDPTPPKDSDAENVAPVGGRRGLIRVEPLHAGGPGTAAQQWSAGKPRSFEELWAGAVFELHNITYAREFLRLHQQAAAGKVGKEEFVAGIWKYEYLAAQRTRAFYAHVFLPFAEKKKLPTDPGLWFAAWWDTAEDTLHGFTDKSSYPWRPYARQHDWMTLQRRYQQGKYREALKLLEEMLADRAYTHDAADVYVWMGRCQIDLNKPALAVEALGKAIQLDPKRADAYELRGQAYQALGQKAKADADFAKAKALSRGRP